MAEQEEQANYIASILSEFNIKIRDLEEKNRLIKERILLLGENLVEIRERNNEDLLKIKKDLEILKTELKRIKIFLESVSGEISNFAKKSDLALLSKQAKMFQPLEFVKKQELKQLIKQELKELKSLKS